MKIKRIEFVDKLRDVDNDPIDGLVDKQNC